jgi:hypothetical protein
LGAWGLGAQVANEGEKGKKTLVAETQVENFMKFYSYCFCHKKLCAIVKDKKCNTLSQD